MSEVGQRVPHGRRGSPLVLLAVLLVGWVSARAAIWESPFPASLPELTDPTGLLAQAEPAVPMESLVSPLAPAFDVTAPTATTIPTLATQPVRLVRASGWVWDDTIRRAPRRNWASGLGPIEAHAHHLLLASGLDAQGRTGASQSLAGAASGMTRNPPIAQSARAATDRTDPRPDRWMFDAFTFYRAGSGAQSISAGRVAIYGASQSGARLQYRFIPSSRHDPRAYVRAYKALVSGGESEIAAGVSARPVGAIPLRAYAEVRLTDTPLFGPSVRPAGYVVTELAPIDLPLAFALEAYGGAGYVGGEGATYFVDGQLVATREITRLALVGDNPLRISMGGGAWGGMQRDAGRLDLGPTVRLDFDLGKIPTRVSVDWREQVVGDAEPGSGLAATLSTQF